MSKQKNKKTKNKGFSMIEMLISMFIFSLIISLVVQIFAYLAKNSREAQARQESLENSQMAMELVAKTVRMSRNVEPLFSSKGILMFNNSLGKCVSFKLEDGKIKGDLENLENDPENCSSVSYDYEEITPSLISDGFFEVTPTTDTSIGKVTILFKTSFGNLQTTVSLRDFKSIKPN